MNEKIIMTGYRKSGIELFFEMSFDELIADQGMFEVGDIFEVKRIEKLD